MSALLLRDSSKQATLWPAAGRVEVRTGKEPKGLIHGLVLGMAVLVGCAPPLLRQAAPAEIHTGRLTFLTDGQTTREEVLLALGTPNGHFEGDRILTYALIKTASGEWWTLGGRNPDRVKNQFVYEGRSICSLVLIFGADGRLTRHSLVVSG